LDFIFNFFVEIFFLLKVCKKRKGCFFAKKTLETTLKSAKKV